MIGFAVVGLGMGRNRARQVAETAGAELRVGRRISTRTWPAK